MRISKTKTTNKTTSGGKKTIHNVFIVDASGSMEGSRYTTAMSGLNELLKDIQTDTDTDNTVTIVEFEGSKISTRQFFKTDLKSYDSMGCGGTTPLNQAIGETLEKVKDHRNTTFSKDDKVLVSVFTDGGENSSQGKYKTSSVLSTLIKELEAEGFTVTFMGTQEEVNYAINILHMNAGNTAVHFNTAASIGATYTATRSARQNFSKSVCMDSLDGLASASFYTNSDTLSNPTTTTNVSINQTPDKTTKKSTKKTKTT